MVGKLNLIGIGGAGIKVAIDSYEYINELGNEFSESSINLLDTNTKTIKDYTGYTTQFKLVSTNKVNTSEYDGTAGERNDKDRLKDFNSSVKEYVDTMAFDTGRENIYVICIAGGGGTGSSIGMFLCDIMLKLGYTVCMVVVGDSSTYLRVHNTSKVLEGLYRYGVKHGVTLPVIHYDNGENGITNTKSEQIVNGKIRRTLGILSLFISGTVHNLDLQDVINLLVPSKYNTFNVSPGIYRVAIGSGDVSNDKLLLMLSIVKDKDTTFNIDVDLLNSKTGVSSIVKDIYDADSLHLMLLSSDLDNDVVRYQDRVKELSNKLLDGSKTTKIRNTVFNATEELDDDDLLV